LIRPNGLFVAIALLLATAATVFGALAAPSGHHAQSEAGRHEHPIHAGAHHGESKADHDEHASHLGAHEGTKDEKDALDSSEGLAALAVSVLAIALVLIGIGTSRSVEPLGVLRFAVAVASAGAATIHFAVIDQHVAEYWLFGVFFAAVGLTQLGWVVAVVNNPTRTVYVVGALGNALIAATWVISRTTGLPFGPAAGEPESVGIADVVSTALELAVVVGTLLLLRGHELQRSWELRFVRPVVVIAASAVTALALAVLAGL
jgi:hypothetical protein